jgi:hypothetical protein
MVANSRPGGLGGPSFVQPRFEEAADRMGEPLWAVPVAQLANSIPLAVHRSESSACGVLPDWREVVAARNSIRPSGFWAIVDGVEREVPADGTAGIAEIIPTER